MNVLPSKRVFYDARSLNPAAGDTVTVIIQHLGQETPEELTAVFLGSVQLESYTTPYFKFMAEGTVRLINSNAVREWRYAIATPDLAAPQLEAKDETW